MPKIKVFTSLKQVNEAIADHEEETSLRYVVDESQKRFASNVIPATAKINWKLSARKQNGLSLEYDGVPFIFMGKKSYICQHGRDKGLSMKRKWKEAKERRMREEQVIIGNRCLQQPTKKMGCPATIEIKKIIKFPEFKVCKPSADKCIMRRKLQQALHSETTEINAEMKFVCSFPLQEEHNSHLGQQIKARIDQGNMEKLLAELHPSDHSFYRACTTPTEDAPIVKRRRGEQIHQGEDSSTHKEKEVVNDRDSTVTGEKLLFVYQTTQMQRLYRKYGQTVFLDAIHRTYKHVLPSYFLMVRTNVDFQVAAVFVLQNATKDSLAEALSIIKSWSPDVSPKFGLADFATEEIKALEETFEGIKVFISEFHQEQAWARWLSKASNGTATHPENVEEIKSLLTRMASSSTDAQLQAALTVFQSSQCYKTNAKLQHWFGNIWHPAVKRWCYAFMPEEFLLSVLTNNGVEHFNEGLKYSFLNKRRKYTLSEVLAVLIKQFLPGKYQRYKQLNVQNSHVHRYWSTDIPHWLKNKPMTQYEDYLAKMQKLKPTETAFVRPAGEKTFTISHEEPASMQYTVKFGNDRECCSCTCHSFQSSKMLCEHFFLIMTADVGCGWEDISSIYRDHPVLNLDWDIINSPSATDFEEEEIPDEDENMEDTEEDQNASLRDITLRQDEMNRLLVSARSTLKRTIDLTYKSFSTDKLEAIHTWVTSAEENFRKLKALVK